MKRLIGNVKGPQGEPGPQGSPGDLSQIGGIGELADVVENKLTDLPDLALIFENKLI
jgi:hypothetical protein